jgi:hypothetical protein
MPKLADLYGVDLNRLGKYRPEYTSVMERPLTPLEEEQRAAPVDREYSSGRLEAPMFSPDDLIGSGVFTKLTPLAKGLGPALAAGIQSGKAEVYSLRGKNGKPVATVEIDASDPNRPLITQVRGRFNKTSLPDDVEAMIQGFAEKRGAEIASR